jgi:hypothetical protein
LAGRWRKQRNEELHNVYFPSGTDRVIAYEGCERQSISKMKSTYRILVGKSEGSRPLGRLSANDKIILKYMKV